LTWPTLVISTRFTINADILLDAREDAAYSFAFSFPVSMRQSETRLFKTALAMIFKLAEAAERSWRRLDGYNQLPTAERGNLFRLITTKKSCPISFDYLSGG
jgi:hypothetical protein